MQTKLFVFFAILAFCHVSYCDTTVAAGSTSSPEDAQKLIQEFKDGMMTAVNVVRGQLGKAFNNDTMSKISNSIAKNSSLSVQQIEEIVQKTFEAIRDEIKSAANQLNVPDPTNLSQVGDTVSKTLEIVPETMKKILSFLEDN